jgi:hypothetical protein
MLVMLLYSHADGLAESEKTREEHIRVKNLRTLNERGKGAIGGSAGNISGFRADDFGMSDMLGARRGCCSLVIHELVSFFRRLTYVLVVLVCLCSPMPKRVGSGNIGRKGRM